MKLSKIILLITALIFSEHSLFLYAMEIQREKRKRTSESEDENVVKERHLKILRLLDKQYGINSNMTLWRMPATKRKRCEEDNDETDEKKTKRRKKKIVAQEQEERQSNNNNQEPSPEEELTFLEAISQLEIDSSREKNRSEKIGNPFTKIYVHLLEEDLSPYHEPRMW